MSDVLLLAEGDCGDYLLEVKSGFFFTERTTFFELFEQLTSGDQLEHQVDFGV
jgi:hypothetical protein